MMIASNFELAPPGKVLQILHLEDSPLDHTLVLRALTESDLDFLISRVDTLEAFQKEVADGDFDVILADYRLQGFDALDAWQSIANVQKRIPFILVSGAIGEGAAVSAIQAGISDYLNKNELASLARAIVRNLDTSAIKVAKAEAEEELRSSQIKLARFTEHLQETIEHERASIAREVHDDIGGALAAVNLDLAWISRHSQDAALQTHIQSAVEMLQHAVGASQRIMMNLRPSILDQGLVAAMFWLAAGFEKRTGIKATVKVNKERVADDKAIQLVAFRTTQESLTNAFKHAKCSLVQIEVSDEEGVLTVEICDNGVGISLSDREKPDSFGIRGLQERAKTVGGWLDVSRSISGGTSIILSVPLNEVVNCAKELAL